MKIVLRIAFVAGLGACGSKETKPAPATSADCAEAGARLDELRMQEQHASPEEIQQLKDARAKTAEADVRTCTLNNTHAWSECVKTAKTSKDATSCK